MRVKDGPYLSLSIRETTATTMLIGTRVYSNGDGRDSGENSDNAETGWVEVVVKLTAPWRTSWVHSHVKKFVNLKNALAWPYS